MENNKCNELNETESEFLMNGEKPCLKGEEVSVSMTSSLTYKSGSLQSLSNDCSDNADIVWHNVKYIVHKKSLRKANNKTIELIRNASGKGLAGKVTAILGPSGAGKTTLLECIAGIRTVGLSGDIYVTSGPKTKFAYCAQRDHHLEELTVWETLMFASKLKNYNKKQNPTEKWDQKAHQQVVSTILKQLGLESCTRVRMAACSGGQRKRLSIGIELVTRPNVLFLDEPTSGLDSTSCLQCVKLMHQLSRGSQALHPMVVIASLHQPSAQVLNQIDYLYIMANGGRPIYYGPPSELKDCLNSFGMSCPMYETTTDFAISVAAGDHGIKVIERMAFNQIEKSGFCHEMPEKSTNVAKIVQKSKRKSHPFFMHVWQLLVRTHLCTWRQPQLTVLRLVTSVTIAVLISYIFKNPIGEDSCCADTALVKFDIMRPMGDCIANMGFFFFSILFIALSSKMPTILTFPLEMNVFVKERTNGWYSCSAYYTAKSLADIPYQVVFPLIYCLISYFATKQILDIWRMSIFYGINIILAFISQTVGLVIGAVFAEDFTSAVYAAALITAPLLLFCGFLVPFRDMPDYLFPLSYLSWFKYAMESIVIGMYGFGRCGVNSTLSGNGSQSLIPQQTLPNMNKMLQLAEYLNENDLMGEALWVLNEGIIDQFKSGGSLVLKFFILEDHMLWTSMATLLGFMLGIRFMAYYLLLWKVNRNK